MLKFISFFFCVLLSQQTHSQNAEDIIANHIAAIGGAENWNKINTIQIEAVMKTTDRDIPVKRSIVHDKAMRMDFIIAGINAWQILTKTQGWSYMPFGGEDKAMPLNATEVKESQDELSARDEFVIYVQQQKKATYLGREKIDGIDAHKLKLTSVNGLETFFWIDPSTWFTFQQMQLVSTSDGQTEVVTHYSNFRKTPEGIVYPFTIAAAEGTISVNTLKINLPLDDALFKPLNTK